MYSISEVSTVVDFQIKLKMFIKLTKETSKSTESRWPKYGPIDTGAVLTASGKPSTWFPLKRLYEKNFHTKNNKISYCFKFFKKMTCFDFVLKIVDGCN